MAGNIKGIIIEIGGDTSGLQKSLNKVNSVTSGLNKELTAVNKLLKLDPKSTELLSQKQDILNEKISTTKDKLSQLKNVQEKFIKSGGNITSDNYRALQREIIKTQQELTNLENVGKKSLSEIGTFVTNTGSKIETFGKNISGIGDKLTLGISMPIVGATVAALNYTSEIEQLQTSFEVMTGSAEKAAEIIKTLKEIGAETPFELTDLATTVQLLMNYGLSADDAIAKVKMLGDISQGSAEKMNRISMAYGQMSSANKVTLEDVKQMIEAGFNPLLEISEATGESMDSLYDRISKGTISVDEITASMKRSTSVGGKYFQSMAKQSETSAGMISTLKDETASLGAELVKNLVPVTKTIIKKATNLVRKLGDMSDEEKENVVQLGLMLVALGPTVKLIGTLTTTVGKGVKVIGTFTEAVGVMKTGLESSNKTANTLASIIGKLGSPSGAIAIGIGATVGLITLAVKEIEKAQETVKDSVSTIGDAASNYIAGISTAESHLDKFNSTIFANSEEQQRLAENMEEIQNGITSICKTASDERRDYTQDEIIQLDEYFTKLRELSQREVEIQQEISKAITQQAITNAETFEGTLEEYQTQSQEWINTALEQKNATLDLIERQTIEEVALLNQRYGEQANMQNEAYAAEYNTLMKNKQDKISLANDEMAKVTAAYSNGYADRLLQQDDFKTKIEEFNTAIENENKRHNDKLLEFDNSFNQSKMYQEKVRREEAFDNTVNISKIYKNLFENMNESEQKQLGTLMGMASNTEIYGGQMTNKTSEIVSTILNNYEKLPSGTKSIMKDAMSPMFEAMQNAEPSLYSKATGIANGILSRLRKAFDIHSPSRKTREIFENLMQGGIVGIDAERKNLLKEIDIVTEGISNKLSKISAINMGKIKSEVVDKTNSVVQTGPIELKSDSKVTPDILKSAFKEALSEMNLAVFVDKEKLGEIATASVDSNFGGAW